ncbi:uncharacterized protein LOC117181774 isoform X1 [Belonocnema kinseyi]|uniref:uncharacterized protein LOC117181774 isoform X1 n=1 Tax=Belonocnema kinseyi TaxID=2817044 RepID=UPI00143D16F1|nr:uncharacterized protein LOC117181774 isoform X1 [Belonocnema kinseyi]
MIGTKLLALIVVFIFSVDSCSASGMEGRKNVNRRRLHGSSSNQPTNDEGPPGDSNLYSAHTNVISSRINSMHANYEQHSNQEHINNHYQRHIAGRNRKNTPEAPLVAQDHSHYLYDQEGENNYSLLNTGSIPGHTNFAHQLNPTQQFNPTQQLNPTQHLDPNLSFDPNLHNLDVNYFSQNHLFNPQQSNIPYDPASFQNQPHNQYLHPPQNPRRH